MGYDIAKIVKELRDTKCRCGCTKPTRKSFCPTCYSSLPESVQRGIYKGFGNGYEENYGTACKLLDEARQREIDGLGPEDWGDEYWDTHPGS